MRNIFSRWVRETRGTTSIEYALIAAGISLAVAGFIFVFGTDLADFYVELSDRIYSGA